MSVKVMGLVEAQAMSALLESSKFSSSVIVQLAQVTSRSSRVHSCKEAIIGNV